MFASEHTVTEVCFEIGYESRGSFSNKFRAGLGRSPASFQREIRCIFGYSAPWRVVMPGCFLQAWAVE
jgi:AraC-like DNA-binding protein